MKRLRKPYDTFPLTPHPSNRGWSKKYRGRYVWISIVEPDAALREFHRKARAIDEDREGSAGKAKDSAVSVGNIMKMYAAEREADVAGGRLSARTLEDYRIAAVEFVKRIGKQVLVSDLRPDDFTKVIRHWESGKLGAHSIARRVQSIRTIFRHAADQDWCDLPRFGRAFRKPATGHSQAAPFTIEEVRKLLAVRVTDQFRAMMLLAVNCGFGNTDCSEVTVSHLHIESANSYHDFPRPKTDIKRCCPLWDETVAALRKCPPTDDAVFTTARGHRWVRFEESRTGIKAGRDAIGREFRNVCLSAGVTPRGFYGLRHLFRTIADELETPSATARIMGHRLDGMADRYVDEILHDRLREITDHVKARLFPSGLPAMTVPLVRGAASPLPEPAPAPRQSRTRGSGS